MMLLWFSLIYLSQNKASGLILINYGLWWLGHTVILEVMDKWHNGVCGGENWPSEVSPMGPAITPFSTNKDV